MLSMNCAPTWPTRFEVPNSTPSIVRTGSKPSTSGWIVSPTAAEFVAAASKAEGEARSSLLSLALDQSLRERIVSCTDCDLHRTATAPVPWENNAPIAIIGEAPGHSEDRSGRPFVGQSGNLLNKILSECGWQRHEVSFINTICCRPPSNDFYKAIEADAPLSCRPLFRQQLDRAGAWILVPVGNTALTQLLPDLSGGITTHRGKMYWRDHHLIMPTFHPAYALRNPEGRSRITQDLLGVRRVFQSVEQAPVPKSYDPSTLLDTFRDSDFSKLDRKAVKSTWKKKGWVMVYSKWVEDTVILKRDDSVIVPPHVKGVHYTVHELTQLASVGNRTWSDARRLHYAKKEFEGTLI